MKLQRVILLFTLSFACAIIAAAQAGRCTTTMAQLPSAPELFGLRLGMSVEQVNGIIPIERDRTDSSGVMKTTVNPEFNPKLNRAAFQGVRSLSFEFLDGKLYWLGIGYNESFKWQTMDQFLAGMNKSLNLPDLWESRSWRGKELDCSDVSFTARMLAGSPGIIIIDKGAEQTVNQRIAAKADAEENSANADENAEAASGMVVSRYKAGQVWSYKTRPGEKDSTFIVLKVEHDQKLGNIIHIAVRGLKIKRPDGQGSIDTIRHLPFGEEAINRSAVKLMQENAALPDYEEGYEQWRQAFDAGSAGIYTITVAEAVVVVEAGIKQ